MTIGAVDIGRTKIVVGMVDDTGRVLSRAECPNDADDYRSCLDLIASKLRETAQNAGTEISGIGIGSTGPLNPFTGEFGAVDFLPGWQGRNMVKDLERLFNVQAAMENDADAAVLDEAAWGMGKHKSLALIGSASARARGFGESRIMTGRGTPDKGTRTDPLARTTNYGD